LHAILPAWLSRCGSSSSYTSMGLASTAHPRDRTTSTSVACIGGALGSAGPTSRNSGLDSFLTRHHSSLSGEHDTDRGDWGPNALGRGLPTLPTHVGALYRWRAPREMRNANVFASCRLARVGMPRNGLKKDGGLNMQSERFESLVSARGPFVSIYIDDSRNAADAEAQLDAKWRDVRRHLAGRGVDEDIIVTLERAVLHSE